MSNILKQILEFQKTDPEMDFHTRTTKMIELLKKDKEENGDALSNADLIFYERFISIEENEFKESFTWFPIDKIKEGLTQIESDRDFLMVYPDWKEVILLKFNAFAGVKFMANVLKKTYPSPDKGKFGSQLAAKFDFLNKIFRSKEPDSKGTAYAKNDVYQIIKSNKLPYKLTEIANNSARALQKDGVPISKKLANKLINFIGKHFLGLNIDVVQKGIFDGVLDEIGTNKLDKKTGKESITSKCRLLWLVFQHTHPLLHHKQGAQGRSTDALNREALLRIIQLKRRKSKVS
jgi:DNA modification methylase